MSSQTEETSLPLEQPKIVVRAITVIMGGAGSPCSALTTAVAIAPDPSTATRSAFPTVWAAIAAIESCGESGMTSRA